MRILIQSIHRQWYLNVGFGSVPAFLSVVIYFGPGGIAFVEKVIIVRLITNLTSAQLGHWSDVVTFLRNNVSLPSLPCK